MGGYHLSKYADSFYEFAWKNDGYEYARVEEDCSGIYPVPYPSLMFLRQFPPHFQTYEGRTTKSAIRDWVKMVKFRKVFELNEEGMYRIFGEEQRMAIIMFRKDEDEGAQFMSSFHEVAENYNKPKLLWAYSNKTDKDIT